MEYVGIILVVVSLISIFVIFIVYKKLCKSNVTLFNKTEKGKYYGNFTGLGKLTTLSTDSDGNVSLLEIDIGEKFTSVYRKSLYDYNLKNILNKISGKQISTALYLKNNFRYFKNKLKKSLNN